MSSKKPFDTEHTITDAPPVRPAGPSPFAADEKTVHVSVPNSDATLNVVPPGPASSGSEATAHGPIPSAKPFDPQATVDGPAGSSNPALPVQTLDAEPERPRPKPARPAATIHEPAPEKQRPHDTLDDPAPPPKAAHPAPLASISDVEPMVTPSTALPPLPPGPSLDRLVPLAKAALDRRLVIGIPVVLGVLLTWWAFSPPDAPAPMEQVLIPPAPPLPAKVEAPATPEVDSAGIFVEVNVGGKIERRPGGKVSLNSNPPTNVSLVKGQKLGRTPTEVIAEVGPLDLLFENHELGITKAVTITVKPGLGGKETIDFGRGWLDIDAPGGSKVSVDGKVIGTAPVAQQTLYEGRHTVTVVFADGKKNVRQLSVVAGETLSHLVAEPR